jgi:hypothetical protein
MNVLENGPTVNQTVNKARDLRVRVEHVQEAQRRG